MMATKIYKKISEIKDKPEMPDSKKAAKLKLISDVKEYCRNHSIKSAVRFFHICRNTVRNHIRNEFEELKNYNFLTVKRCVIASKSEIIKSNSSNMLCLVDVVCLFSKLRLFCLYLL